MPIVDAARLGGVGKTRLALHAASELTPHFPDGATFVALEALPTSEAIPSSLVKVLGLTLQSDETSLKQVTEFIADKRMLLVLDNFEGLVEGAAMLSSLLAACPHLKLLVTSRERLNLEEEHSLPIAGLGLPQELPALEEAAAHDALELFAQRARRVQPSFVLTADELPNVLSICRLVRGFPLGLELAAVWVRVMACADIAREIGSGLTPANAVPHPVNPLHGDQDSPLAVDGDGLHLLSAPHGGFMAEPGADPTPAAW